MVYGLSVSMAMLSMGGEAHLNPAVTIAMTLTLRLRPWRAILYVMAQLSGSLAAAALVLGLTGDISPTVNQLAPGVQVYQAVLLETLVTFQLVLVVLATTHLMSSHPSLSVLASLFVGLAVSLGHLQAITLRRGMRGDDKHSLCTCLSVYLSVCPGQVYRVWDESGQVFWAGPCAGACLAVLLNDLLLRPRWGCLGDWWAELKEFFPSEQLDTHSYTP
ncbi:Aquaporin-1 [Merluccius polli]|uniref:Aquaporin-1 n=1 Tax=Merluccius polli TaxID=89951 RepID=A0AA47P996_MERPO|nr:Aquaporin-1 [Merluccius polli]